MSALQLAKGLNKDLPVSKEFFELLVKKFPDLPPVEELMNDSDLQKFVPSKKGKSTDVETRRGVYNEKKCHARIWKTKKGSKLGYDNIQCSSNHIDGCLCRKHAKLNEQGKLWLGLINKERPENPWCPPDTKNPRQHFWSTDEDGNDIVVEEKKKGGRKKRSPKRSIDDLTTDELKEFIRKKEQMMNDGDNESEISDGDDFETITFEGVDYKMGKEDKIILSSCGEIVIGKWDTEKEVIIFDDKEEEEKHKSKSE